MDIRREGTRMDRMIPHLLVAILLLMSARAVTAESSSGTELVKVGDFVFSNWRSDDFKGSAQREWDPAGHHFAFTWKTDAGDQIGRVGLTYGSSYLGAKIDEMNSSCVMSARASFQPSSSKWFLWSIYGWMNPVYTYWDNTPGGKGWSTEFYIVCYTDEPSSAFLTYDKNLVSLGRVDVDGVTYDCYHRPGDHPQWWAVNEAKTWTPSVNIKKIFDYWRSKGLDNEYVVDLGWALEGFPGTGGKLEMTDVKVPHLQNSSRAPQ